MGIHFVFLHTVKAVLAVRECEAHLELDDNRGCAR